MRIARLGAAAMLLGMATLCGGCSIMPTTGPEIGEIHRGGNPSDPERLPSAVVKVTPQVLDILATWVPRIGNAFTDRRPPQEIKFGIGDVVSISVFEAASGGLFIPAEASVRPGNFIALP